ncbi:MAG: trypsin-like peptidase domain-containing protein [Candidatus Bathyarchaeia archaeon]
MEWEHTITIDKRFILALLFVSLALGGGFALIYLDLKADLNALKIDYADVASQLEELQALIEQLHYTKTLNLTAVQIYNRTRNSVVLITAGAKSGSGFVYDVRRDKGYIVTNHHVVDSEGEITVTFFIDGKPIQVPAKIRGEDVYSDLAVLELIWLPEKAKPLLIGDSTIVMVGEPVYAIGNPFGLEGSMTAGIVSQVSRVLRLGDLGVPEPWGSFAIVDLIQFDAAINPGNSGGPLLNSLGEVIGVTFAIETTEEVRAFIGIGYAIPSIIMNRVADSIINEGRYEHPWIGITYNSSYIGGLLIVDVNVSGPADQAGLEPGDIVIEVDNRTVNRAEDLIIYIERYKSPGDKIKLKVKRGDKDFEVILTLGKRLEYP